MVINSVDETCVVLVPDELMQQVVGLVPDGICVVCKDQRTEDINRLLMICAKRMEHVPNMFMSFDKYLFLEVVNILI